MCFQCIECVSNSQGKKDIHICEHLRANVIKNIVKPMRMYILNTDDKIDHTKHVYLYFATPVKLAHIL